MSEKASKFIRKMVAKTKIDKTLAFYNELNHNDKHAFKKELIIARSITK